MMPKSISALWDIEAIHYLIKHYLYMLIEKKSHIVSPHKTFLIKNKEATNLQVDLVIYFISSHFEND